MDYYSFMVLLSLFVLFVVTRLKVDDGTLPLSVVWLIIGIFNLLIVIGVI